MFKSLWHNVQLKYIKMKGFKEFVMLDVYKFKVRLCELEDVMWREIEITSSSSVAKLGYSVMAAFEATECHLFNIQFGSNRYETMFEEDDFEDEPAIDPIRTKLSSLKLIVGDKLSMEYDYGAGWEFEIELLSIVEMKPGAGKRYPHVTNGEGKGIIEDTSPYDLAEIIKKTDKDGSLPLVFDEFLDKEVPWDYRKFDLELCNIFLKHNVMKFQETYEEFI